jgi:hypothetical protein
MNKSPAYQFYPDKWQVDTRRLTWEQKGIFKELCCVVWLQFQETCSFPDDDKFIASEIGCDLETWKSTKAELLNPHRPILGKTETNRLFIGGLVKELEKQGIRRDRLRQNGMLGGRPKNQKVISEEPKNKAGPANLNERLPTPSPSPALRSIATSESATALESLTAELNGLYKRPINAHWSYAEQSTLAEIARRPDAKAELDHILDFRRNMAPDDRRRFFPQSINSLLSKWTETLDKARIQCPKKAAPILPEKTVKRINEETPSREMLVESIKFLEASKPDSLMLKKCREQLASIDEKK